MKVERTEGDVVDCELDLVKIEADGKKLAAYAAELAKQKEQQRDEEARENERAKKHAELVARLQSDYSNALRAHRDREAKVRAAVEACRKAVSDLEVRKARGLSRVDTLAGDLAKPLTENCPTCGQKLQEEKLAELRAQREAKQGELEKAQQAVLDIDVEIEAGKRREGDAKADIPQAPQPPTLPAFDESLRPQFDPTLDGRIAKAQAAVEEARKQYIEANGIRAGLNSQLKLYQQRIAELEKQQAEIEEKQKAITTQKAEAAEWRYLERACGADGIQALELDALGPGIAEVANRLLSAAYGTRFAVEFRTTRIAGRGSKVKQVEDFSIWINDSERESEQELSTLSGGERVWIIRALYDAFAIIRDRNTGIRFLTACQDEADGALDPEARQAYFAMLRAAHVESGRRNTIIVTHSEAAQEAIPQQITMVNFCATGVK